MIITYHGVEMTKVSFGDTTLAFNPISKDSAYKPTRFGADIALVSLEHPDMNGTDAVSLGERQPFIVRGPGEYEVGGVLIKGYATKSSYDGEERINTVYLVTLEGMLMLHLGALGTKDLPVELREQLDEVDIVFVPIGGDGVLEPDEAHELAVSIEPRLIIPLHYPQASFGGPGGKDALKTFLKEDAYEKNGFVDKLTIKRKDLEGRQSDVILLSV